MKIISDPLKYCEVCNINKLTLPIKNYFELKYSNYILQWFQDTQSTFFFFKLKIWEICWNWLSQAVLKFTISIFFMRKYVGGKEITGAHWQTLGYNPNQLSSTTLGNFLKALQQV